MVRRSALLPLILPLALAACGGASDNGEDSADANGGSSGLFFPSRYFDPSDYPSYLNGFVERSRTVLGQLSVLRSMSA